MNSRAVFDCMLFLQAISSPNGPAMACFDRAQTAGVQLCSSPQVEQEILSILMKPELHRRIRQLTPERVSRFLDQYKQDALLIRDVPVSFRLPRDPKDEPYINLAIAAGVSHLVTWNDRHLTYLMRQDTPEGINFCLRYPHLKILTPVEFLKKFA